MFLYLRFHALDLADLQTAFDAVRTVDDVAKRHRCPVDRFRLGVGQHVLEEIQQKRHRFRLQGAFYCENGEAVGEMVSISMGITTVCDAIVGLTSAQRLREPSFHSY